MDRNWIGGSDIAAVMGLSRWKTPLQLWAEKTGKIEPDDLSGKEAVEWGTRLEEVVAKKFQEMTGVKVRRSPKRYTHPNHQHFKCQVDRLVEGTDDLLEVKTCSAWLTKEWEGEEIPRDYILQVMWQLGITKRKVGYIAVLIGGQAFKYKKVTFDPAMFKKMIESAVEFWKLVQSNQEPMAVGDDNKFIVDLHPESDEQIQETEELNDGIGLRQQLKGTLKETQAQLDEIESGIKQVIGDNLGIRSSEYEVTFKTQKGNRVNTQLLKDASVYDKYTAPTSTRVLRVKLRKDEKNGKTK